MSEESDEERQCKKARKVYPDCELADAVTKGHCAIKGCKGQVRTGCKTHDLRLCWPGCLQRHLTGCGIITEGKGSMCKRKAIEWKDPTVAPATREAEGGRVGLPRAISPSTTATDYPSDRKVGNYPHAIEGYSTCGATSEVPCGYDTTRWAERGGLLWPGAQPFCARKSEYLNNLSAAYLNAHLQPSLPSRHDVRLNR